MPDDVLPSAVRAEHDLKDRYVAEIRPRIDEAADRGEPYVRNHDKSYAGF